MARARQTLKAALLLSAALIAVPGNHPTQQYRRRPLI